MYAQKKTHIFTSIFSYISVFYPILEIKMTPPTPRPQKGKEFFFTDGLFINSANIPDTTCSLDYEYKRGHNAPTSSLTLSITQKCLPFPARS
jgi:hypothetical protein